MLAGGSALTIALPPRFRLRVGPTPGQAFHPDSPAGRWAKLRGVALAHEWLEAPHRGWGSSTAEFAAVFAHLLGASGPVSDAASWLAADEAYRKVHATEALPPSGADLAVQWAGGLGVLKRQDQPVWTQLPWLSDGARASLSLFSAAHQEGRKTPTHLHLARMEAHLGKLQSLVLPSERGVEIFRKEEWRELGAWIRGWVGQLGALGFEHPATRADRLVFEGISGVYGAKGCGAMLSDSLLVVHAADAQGRVRAAGEGLGLEWVSIPSESVPGITRE